MPEPDKTATTAREWMIKAENDLKNAAHTLKLADTGDRHPFLDPHMPLIDGCPPHPREYRTRLTADVVTGKVDARHLALGPGDEPLEAEDLAESIEDGEIQADGKPEFAEEVDA